MNGDKNKFSFKGLLLIVLSLFILVYLFLPPFNPLKNLVAPEIKLSVLLLSVLFLIGIISAIYDINISLIVLILSLVFETMVRIYGSVDIATTEIILLAIGLVIVYKAFIKKRDFKFIKGYFLFILFFLSGLITIIFAPDRIATFKQIIRWFEFPVIFAILYYKRDEINLNLIINSIIFLFSFVAIIGIVQRFVNLVPGFLPYYGYSLQGGILRSYSTLTHPNVLAIYMGATGIISLGKFIHSFNKDKNFKTILYFIAFLIINLALLFSFSRGGIISIVAGYILFFILIRKDIVFKRKLLIYLTPLIIGLVFFIIVYGAQLYKYTYNTIGSIFAGSVEGHDEFRFSYLRSAIDMIKERPVFGWGSLGSDESVLENISHQFNIPYIKGNIIGWSHSTYLSILVEFGISGFLFFILYIVYLIGISFKRGLNGIKGNLLRISFIVIFLNAIFKVILIKSIHIFAGIIIALTFADMYLEDSTNYDE